MKIIGKTGLGAGPIAAGSGQTLSGGDHDTPSHKDTHTHEH